MAVFKVNKTKNYTVMSNAHLRDKALTLKAKGILSLMLSLPEGWDYSIAGLETLSADGASSIRTALKELEERGYLTRTIIRNTNGKFIDWQYNIFEIPQTEQAISPVAENPQVEKPQVGNRRQLNKEIISIKEVSKKVSVKENISERVHAKNTLSYDELLDDIGIFGLYREAIFRFIAHLNMNGVKVINERLKNIIAALEYNYDSDSDRIREIDEAISRGYLRLPSEE